MTTAKVNSEKAICLTLDVMLGAIKLSTVIKAYVVEGIGDKLYLGMPLIAKYGAYIPWATHHTKINANKQLAIRDMDFELMICKKKEFLNHLISEEEQSVGLLVLHSQR